MLLRSIHYNALNCSFSFSLRSILLILCVVLVYDNQFILLSISIWIFHMFLLLHLWLQWIFFYMSSDAHMQGFLWSICLGMQLMGHTVYKSSNLAGHAELFSKVVIPIFIFFLYDYWPSMFHFCRDDYSCLFLIFLVVVSLLLIISIPGIKKNRTGYISFVSCTHCLPVYGLQDKNFIVPYLFFLSAS